MSTIIFSFPSWFYILTHPHWCIHWYASLQGYQLLPPFLSGPPHHRCLSFFILHLENWWLSWIIAFEVPLTYASTTCYLFIIFKGLILLLGSLWYHFNLPLENIYHSLRHNFFFFVLNSLIVPLLFPLIDPYL